MKIGTFTFPLKLNEVTRGYFEKMAGLEQGQTASDLKAIVQPNPDQAAIAQARGDTALQLHDADDVRGDDGECGSRDERAATACDGERQLPHPARRRSGRGAAHARARHQQFERLRDVRQTGQAEPALAAQAGAHGDDHARHGRDVARCHCRAGDGRRRDRRLVLPPEPAFRSTACPGSSATSTTSARTAKTNAWASKSSTTGRNSCGFSSTR